MSVPRIRIIRHEAVPQTRSFEVRFADGREFKYFYFDDVLGRRLRPDIFTCDQALDAAKAFARAPAFQDTASDSLTAVALVSFGPAELTK